MRVSQSGLQKIESRISEIVARLTNYAEKKKLNAEQREDFRDLQDELRVTQRQYRAFSNPESGI